MKLIQQQAKMLDDFHGMYIPKPNEFIPKNFDVERATVETVCVSSAL
jgi:secreted Zn-dependent insulinase-like peptidase